MTEQENSVQEILKRYHEYRKYLWFTLINSYKIVFLKIYSIQKTL